MISKYFLFYKKFLLTFSYVFINNLSSLREQKLQNATMSMEFNILDNAFSTEYKYIYTFTVYRKYLIICYML